LWMVLLLLAGAWFVVRVAERARTSGLQRPSPPPLVLAALAFLAAEFAVGVLRVAIMATWTPLLSALGGILLLTVVYASWLYGLWHRINWLRWVTVVANVWSGLIAPRVVARLPNTTQVVLYVVQVFLSAFAVFLLILPSANRWYRQRILN
jgi:hypothetical protein